MSYLNAKNALILAAALLMLGCGKQVSRIDVESTVDLSGKWNDTDSRLVADEMIKDCLNQRWLYKYEVEKKQPTVIVGEIRNKSHEHNNTETFVKDMEKALINSGKVDFVANKTERDQIREEKADQASHASAETQQFAGNESGADLMLIGSINTIFDKEGNKKVAFYQVDLELIEIETHKKAWIGDKKIKKFISD